jgi:tripartite-type tricarboxylate transporter receptor subunit TctC
MNVRNRAESSTPAIPTTRRAGNPDLFQASCTMASRGLVTSTRIAFLERALTCSTTEPTISAFLNRRSSRVMPGLRASPAVMTTTSESAVSS